MLYTARYIITQNETREILENAALLVRGTVIEAIGPAAELKSQFSDEVVEDLGNAVIMPGLINAHTHIPMSFLRGYSDDKSLMDWLYKDIFHAEAKLTPEVVELATLLSCAELLRFGCTAFYDMYMLERSVFKAADMVGIRAVLGESVSSFFPIKGFVPMKLIWSVINIKSPGVNSSVTAPAAFVIIKVFTPNFFITLTGNVTVCIE
jgi:5-methylthioadenosine/S-adenosylhomocysteine deaminase